MNRARIRLFQFAEAARTLLEPGALQALLRWPKFSFTSFRMVSSLARQGIAPNTSIDVGANVGQFTVAVARIFPGAQIYAFEPEPVSTEHLRRNTRGLPNVTVCPLALGEAEGQGKLHINSYCHSSSLLPIATGHVEAFPYAREIADVEVRVSTLDRVFAGTALEAPVLLKLDVQGYEARVLEGGRETLKRIDFVIAEASFKPMYEGEVLFLDMVAMMKNCGFDFLRPVGWLSNPKTGEILQMDMLFARR